MIDGVEIEIFDIEQDAGAGLAADQVEKRRVRHFRVRPVEHIGYVFSKRNGTGMRERIVRTLATISSATSCVFGNGSKLARSRPGTRGERQMLAVGRRLQPGDDIRDLIEIGKIERHVGADREPDAVGVERNTADEIEDFVAAAPGLPWMQ